MSNTNGLTSLAPVYFTGASDSNIWASKVAPTVVSPVTIVSPDGTLSGTISIANTSGDMTIVPDLAGARMRIGNGNNLFMSPSATTNAQIVVEDDGDVGFYQGGGSTLFLGAAGTIAFQDLSTAPVLRVGADQGRIYDSVYNPVATVTELQGLTTGNVVYDVTATRAAGTYQLQLSIENVVATGTSTNFLEMYVTLPPSTEVVNFSGNEISPSAVGTNLLNMNSGYFTHPGGNMRVEIGASTTPWTGDWVLQLVKVG
jgi:hypothetical protein